MRLRDYLKIYARTTSADAVNGIADWFEQYARLHADGAGETQAEFHHAAAMLREQARLWDVA